MNFWYLKEKRRIKILITKEIRIQKQTIRQYLNHKDLLNVTTFFRTNEEKLTGIFLFFRKYQILLHLYFLDVKK